MELTIYLLLWTVYNLPIKTMMTTKTSFVTRFLAFRPCLQKNKAITHLKKSVLLHFPFREDTMTMQFLKESQTQSISNIVLQYKYSLTWLRENWSTTSKSLSKYLPFVHKGKIFKMFMILPIVLGFTVKLIILLEKSWHLPSVVPFQYPRKSGSIREFWMFYRGLWNSKKIWTPERLE